MIASSKSSPAPISSPSGPYLSIGKAAQLLGCSVQSLREWEKAGKLHSYRTCGGSKFGQRRYLLSELKSQVLGIEGQAPNCKERKVVIYVRVSSQGQAKEGSLERQLERMVAFVAEREGLEREAVKVYKDIASAFGERHGLNNLVDDLIGGNVSRIYVECADRLSRVPALTRLVEHLAKSNGAAIIALDRDTENVDETKNNLLELIEFVTVLANRANGRKSAERQRRVLPLDALEFLREEVGAGRSVRDVVKQLKARGHRTANGEEISARVVTRYLNRVIKTLPHVEAKHSFSSFMGEHLRTKKGGRVQLGAIHDAYRSWCKKNGATPVSAHRCGTLLRTKATPELINGFYWLLDFELVDFANVLDRSKKKQE